MSRMKVTDERYREVPCPDPHCLVRAGQPCRAPNGYALALRLHHKSRRDKWHREARLDVALELLELLLALARAP